MFVNSTRAISPIPTYIPPESPAQDKSLSKRISFIFLSIKAFFGSQKAQFELGTVYKLERKDNDKAIRCFERVVKRGGSFDQAASYQLGRIYRYQKKDSERALEWFKRAASKEGDLTIYAANEAGCIHEEKGETRKARKFFKKVQSLGGSMRMERATDVGVIVIDGPLFSQR